MARWVHVADTKLIMLAPVCVGLWQHNYFPAKKRLAHNNQPNNKKANKKGQRLAWSCHCCHHHCCHHWWSQRIVVVVICQAPRLLPPPCLLPLLHCWSWRQRSWWFQCIFVIVCRATVPPLAATPPPAAPLSSLLLSLLLSLVLMLALAAVLMRFDVVRPATMPPPTAPSSASLVLLSSSSSSSLLLSSLLLSLLLLSSLPYFLLLLVLLLSTSSPLLFVFVVVAVPSSSLLSLLPSSCLADCYIFCPPASVTAITIAHCLCHHPMPLSHHSLLHLRCRHLSHCTAASLVMPLLCWLVVALLTCQQSTTRHDIWREKKIKSCNVGNMSPCWADKLGWHEDMSSKLTFWRHQICHHFQLSLYAYVPDWKVKKHNMYVQSECGKQSKVNYRFNHDIMASFSLDCHPE